MNNSESLSNFQEPYFEKDSHQETTPTIENTSEKIENKPEYMSQEETLAEYQKENTEILEKIQNATEQKEVLTESLIKVRDGLYAGDVPETISNPSLEVWDKKISELEKEKIKAAANYPGDWTLVLRERMLDPITKEKFIQTREAVMPFMKQGEVPVSDGLSYEKPKTYASHYQKQIDEYDENVERIFSKTHVGLGSDFGKDTSKLGSGHIGEEGSVFLDAQKNGKDITTRQKNIIEAHEKGHGLRDFVATDQSDFKHSIDFAVIEERKIETGKREISYLSQAEEIAERMAQLKNYFGFKASDIFTPEHLAYAKEHYVKDTELDNNMTTFLKSVTENTAPKFIETINKYAL